MSFIKITRNSFIPSIAYSAPQWFKKPVQCGPIKEVEQLIKEFNEVAIFGAIAKVSVDEEILEILSQVLRDADTAKKEKNKPKLEVVVSNVSNDNDSNSTDSS